MRAVIQIEHKPCEVGVLEETLDTAFVARISSAEAIEKCELFRKSSQVSPMPTVVYACLLQDNFVAIFFELTVGILECHVEPGLIPSRIYGVCEDLVTTLKRKLKEKGLFVRLRNIELEESYGNAIGVTGTTMTFVDRLVSRVRSKDVISDFFVFAVVLSVGWFVAGLWSLLIAPAAGIVATLIAICLGSIGRTGGVKWEVR